MALSVLNYLNTLFVPSNVVFMPRCEMTWAYSVTPFRPSVILLFQIQFPLIFFVIHGDLQMKFGIQVCRETMQVEFEFGLVEFFFGRVLPLGLKKIPLIFSSTYYLHYKLTFLNEIQNIVVSQEYTG